MSRTDFSRRKFLGLIGATGLVASPVVRSVATTLTSRRSESRWSDPATWGGRLPNASEVAVISRPVVIDRNSNVAGVVVEKGGRLIFDRDKSVTLTTPGNVIVRGRLVMRPRNPRKKHQLVFRGINENSFVGGGMKPISSDVGLWVMDGGKLVAVGSGKKAWARVAGAISAGSRSFSLRVKPAGWRRGDQIVLTPTGETSGGDHYLRFDRGEITSIQDKKIGLSDPTSFAHPEVQAGGKIFSAEALNLTRNVVIQGTPGGRAHIFIRSDRAQKIKNCLIRHMGPRKKDDVVLGRWPIHFHHAMNGSRGSVVKGCVVQDAGSHAYVAHISHGVTFKNCIAYDVMETPFWWDDGDASNNVVYDRCVAAKCTRGVANVSGFAAFRGNGNKMRNCVAVGVQTRFDTNGAFQWPSARNEGLWVTATGLIAHNNQGPGLRFWINSNTRHHIEDAVFFRNGVAGIVHGAYGNPVKYSGVTSVDNSGRWDTKFHARSNGNGQQGQKWTECNLGRLFIEQNLGPSAPNPVQVVDCTVDSIEVDCKSSEPNFDDFIRSTVGGGDITPGDITWTDAPVGARLRFKRRNGTCWKYEMMNGGPQVVDPIPDFE